MLAGSKTETTTNVSLSNENNKPIHSDVIKEIDTSHAESIPKLLTAHPTCILDQVHQTSHGRLNQMANSNTHNANCQNGVGKLSAKLFRKRLRKLTNNGRKKKTLGNKFKKRFNNERINDTVDLVEAEILSTTNNETIEIVPTESFDNFLWVFHSVREPFELDPIFNEIRPLDLGILRDFNALRDITDENKKSNPQG